MLRRILLIVTTLLLAVSGARAGDVGASPLRSTGCGAAGTKPAEVRCRLNLARRESSRAPFAESRPLQLVATRLLQAGCAPFGSTCGSAFDRTALLEMRKLRYAGRIRYVVWRRSADPARFARFILRSNHNSLFSRSYRELGVAFRPGSSANQRLWIAVFGYRY